MSQPASQRNAVPIYDFANQRVVHHVLDRLPIRTEGRALRPLAVKATAPAEAPLARPVTGAAQTRAQK